MSFNPEELREVLAIYQAESAEHLERLATGLVRLERDPAARDALEEIFREAHSLKGAARMIGFEGAERLANALEHLFGLARKGDLTLAAGAVDEALAAIDALGRITEAWLADPAGAPPLAVEEVIGRLRAAQRSEGDFEWRYDRGQTLNSPILCPPYDGRSPGLPCLFHALLAE